MNNDYQAIVIGAGNGGLMTAATLAKKGWAILGLRSMDMSLEDMFVQLITDETGEEVR